MYRHFVDIIDWKAFQRRQRQCSASTGRVPVPARRQPAADRGQGHGEAPLLYLTAAAGHWQGVDRSEVIVEDIDERKKRSAYCRADRQDFLL